MTNLNREIADKKLIKTNLRKLGYKNLKDFCDKNNFKYGTIWRNLSSGAIPKNKETRELINQLTQPTLPKNEPVTASVKMKEEPFIELKLGEPLTIKPNLKYRKYNDKNLEDSFYENVYIKPEEVLNNLFLGKDIYITDSQFYRYEDGIIIKYSRDYFSNMLTVKLINATIDPCSEKFYIKELKKIKIEENNWYECYNGEKVFVVSKDFGCNNYTVITRHGNWTYDQSGWFVRDHKGESNIYAKNWTIVKKMDLQEKADD